MYEEVLNVDRLEGQFEGRSLVIAPRERKNLICLG
jgi:hypothetical protein